MGIFYDDKGKIFTDLIPKNSISVIIQTLTHRIRGQVYIRPEARLKDELNNSDQFIAVTDVVVYTPAGTELYRTDFLTLNREYIIWMIPEDEVSEDKNLAGGEG